jgi:hypothetical protein
MQFSGATCDPTYAPPVSTGVFLSRQAGIFEVPVATTGLTLPVEFDSHFCFFNLGTGIYPQRSDIVIQLELPLGPPVLQAYPIKITVPSGGTGTISVGSSIPGSDEGFSWTAVSNQLWATIDSSGPFSTGRLVPITIAPGTQDGLKAVLSINSDPKYAAPSVRSGPLQVDVTVGTPKQHPVGGVLLVGGVGLDGIEPNSQVYDYTSNTLFTTASPHVARVAHKATRLKDDRVLIVGGATSFVSSGPAPVTATAEIYDPSTLKYIATGSLKTGRQQHTATLLPDGKVLITGGIANDGRTLNSAELYDAASGTFTNTGTMGAARTKHYANLIAQPGTSAKVLVYGGTTAGGQLINTTELWDESTGTFIATNPMANPTVFFPEPALLAPGELDIVGGLSDQGPTASEIHTSFNLHQPVLIFQPVNLSAVGYAHRDCKLPEPRELCWKGDVPGGRHHTGRNAVGGTGGHVGYIHSIHRHPYPYGFLRIRSELQRQHLAPAAAGGAVRHDQHHDLCIWLS